MPTPSKPILWTGRILSILPCLLLFMSAAMKLTRNPKAIEGLPHLGWPERLLIPLGILELTCTLLYLIPQTALLGAILLTGYLGGATATHLRIEESSFFIPPLLGALLWLGLLLREPRLSPLLPPPPLTEKRVFNHRDH